MKEKTMSNSTDKRPLTAEEKHALMEKKRMKRRNRKINQGLIVVTLVISIITVGIMGFNIFRIATRSSNAQGEVLQSDSKRLKNDFYEIGNNPTEIYQTYFKDLTQSLADKDDQAIAENVVKCFIVDYFTWTNKDGNYDVGGSQYIYGEKALSFIEQSRWQFYSDLDLLIEEYGRDQLLEVESVTIVSSGYVEGSERRPDDGYYIEAEWTYKQGQKLDSSKYQNKGFFYVTKGSEATDRYEIFNFAESWDNYTEELNEAYDL